MSEGLKKKEGNRSHYETKGVRERLRFAFSFLPLLLFPPRDSPESRGNRTDPPGEDPRERGEEGEGGGGRRARGAPSRTRRPRERTRCF
jgi:hypothetical protein